MPRVSTFSQIPVPAPTNNLTCEGEQKMAHSVASRMLWQGGYLQGSGGIVVATDAPTYAGSKLIPGGFFATYPRLRFEMVVDTTDGAAADPEGYLITWLLSTTPVGFGPNSSIFAIGLPAPIIWVMNRYILEIWVDPDLYIYSTLQSVQGDFAYNYRGVFLYVNFGIKLDGSVGGASVSTPLYWQCQLANTTFVGVPKVLGSFLTY